MKRQQETRPKGRFSQASRAVTCSTASRKNEGLFRRRFLRPAAVAAAALLFSAASAVTAQTPADLARWQLEAAQVTITRDNWGIAHVKANTDANAVFGMIYT